MNRVRLFDTVIIAGCIFFTTATKAALIPYDIYFTAYQVSNVGQVNTSDVGFPAPGNPDLYFAMGIASAPNDHSFYTLQIFHMENPQTISQYGTWNFSNETVSATILSDTGNPGVYLYFILMDADGGLGDADDSLGDHWTYQGAPLYAEVSNYNNAPFTAADILPDAEGNGWVGNYNLSFSISYIPGEAIVPLPPAVWLFVTGLLGLIGIARRKRRV